MEVQNLNHQSSISSSEIDGLLSPATATKRGTIKGSDSVTIDADGTARAYKISNFTITDVSIQQNNVWTKIQKIHLPKNSIIILTCLWKTGEPLGVGLSFRDRGETTNRINSATLSNSDVEDIIYTYFSKEEIDAFIYAKYSIGDTSATSLINYSIIEFN